MYRTTLRTIWQHARRHSFRTVLGPMAGLLFIPLIVVNARSEEPRPQRDEVWRKLEPYFQPPAEHADRYGNYRSPVVFDDGSRADSSEAWRRRREEILQKWRRRLGAWPALVERPEVKRLESQDREGYVQHHVHVQISPDGKVADGYLLVPSGAGPFPAVLVPYYEPMTSIGERVEGRGSHDYGLQLVKRGFVTLSIGTPGSVEKGKTDTRQLLTEAGIEQRLQPLTILAYVAANCHTALAQMPRVDPANRHHRLIVWRQVVALRLLALREVRLRGLVGPGYRL